ncbi:MAG: right-handed parallel beta-helix repeat-containing protein, partial [Anaerolineae bacterium]|nr:right-handed parallel beta-helix repeat-containing protein [Anaerolineae bacterium]
MIHYRYLLILFLVGGLALAPWPALADGIVGTGSPESCTESAFDSVFYTLQASGGGTLTFNCGVAPHTIIFTAQKPVSADTTLLGGRLVTLSGGNVTSLFQVYANQSLTLGEITVTRSYSPVGAVENFGRLTMRDSQMLNNTATVSGGAIASYGEVSLTNVIIAGNSAAQFGGGLWLDEGRAIIRNSQFSANTGAEGGGGIAASVGTSLTIEGGQFATNKTTGVFAEGGGIRSTGTLTVTNTMFERNSASRGGALFVSDGTATLSQSEFRANWAAYG